MADGIGEGPSDEGQAAAQPMSEGTADTAPGDAAPADTAPGGDPASNIPPLGRTIAIYTAIRLGLLIALTVALALIGRPFGMPSIVALAFAIVLQLPLSVVLFRRQRSDLTAALARAKAKRTAERDRLFTELTGEDPPD